MVKDYQNDKEQLVLDAVKKYPLHSLNKLAEELPFTSRRSIQRILEKNNLSTLPKRLQFAQTGELSMLAEKKEPVQVDNIFKKSVKSISKVKFHHRIKNEPDFRKRIIKFSAVGLFAGILFTNGAGFLFAKDPEIYLKQPGDEVSKSLGEKIYVLGKVIPRDSQVKVNGQTALKNGDGTFTSVIVVPPGESSIKIEATNKFKKSELLKLVSREKTSEEIKKEQEEAQEQKQKTLDKSAQLDSQINDLLAARSVSDKNTGIKIINNKIKEDIGLSRVVGEVVNAGDKDLEFVMVTASFFNKTGLEIDKKFGFANLGKKIKPGESASFETQATSKTFDSYKLDVDWMDQSLQTATVSAQQRPEAFPTDIRYP